MDESGPDTKTASSDGGESIQVKSVAKAPPAETPATEPPEISETSAAPPQPGEVIGAMPDQPAAPDEPSVPSAPDTPAARPATGGSGGGKSWLRWLLFIIVIAALGYGGWWYYQHKVKNSSTTAKTASQSKDVPLLRIGVRQADYGDLYPDISQNDYALSVNSQIFEGLVRYEDKSKIVPDLASDWTNPDDNTWVFTVRKGIKFHDGHTLAPSDVKASLDEAVAGTSGFDQNFAGTIASVSLVGSDKVKITTKSPDPTLLNKLTFLYIIDANLPKGAEPSMAGTGPYKIKPGTKPTDKNYQMVAFDQYHFGRPTTRALDFGNQDGSAGLIKVFNGGKYDIAGSIDPDKIQQAKNATTFKVDEADTLFIGLNSVNQGPMQNKLVREAIRYAVDAKAIGKANNGAIITPLSQMIPPSIPGYNPAITPYKYDVAKAKQLIAQAGYPNGLTLTLSASELDTQEANEIASELKQVGITVTTDFHKDFDEFISYFSSGKAQMFVIDYSSDTLDGADIYNTTLPSANYNNPKVTDLLNEATTTVNPANRLKLLQQASSIVDQDVAIIPLGSTSDLWVINKNYSIRQDAPSGIFPVYFYKVHLK